jgi:putative ATP-dependent endonuclease of OLD family
MTPANDESSASAGDRPRLTAIRIRNYRSIGDWVTIPLPTGAPLVLIGENNAGKSNILRALALILGETWPGNHNPEDHEFFGRSPEGIEMKIIVDLTGMACPKGCNSDIERFIWRYDRDADKPCDFHFEASNCDHTYVTNAVRSDLVCMSVGVDRDLSWQLSYRSKWTTLSKLMRRFHARLTEDEKRVERLKDFYDGLVATFYEVQEFEEFAQTLRDSTAEFGGNMPYGLGIDFSAYDASNFFRSLRLFPQFGGEARAYEELGTGQEQVLAIAFSYAYATAFGGDGLVLAVEEPEAHLHPLAQEWVARKLHELAETGVQVILTTHSPYFVNLSRPGTTVLVRKSGEEQPTTTTQLRPTQLVDAVKSMGAPDSVTKDNIGLFYESAATNEVKVGLFSRACVLVEGATEAFGLAELLRTMGVDLVRLGIALVPVDGVTNLPKWVRYFRAHTVPVYPILDTDSSKTGQDAEKSAKARVDLWKALELDDQKDWSDHVAGPIGAHAKFAIFDSDYEGAMRQVFGDTYKDLESEARQLIGDSKPLIARFVARRLSASAAQDDDRPEPWDALEPLAASIRMLVSP